MLNWQLLEFFPATYLPDIRVRSYEDLHPTKALNPPSTFYDD
jgi:hypothetical protein